MNRPFRIVAGVLLFAIHPSPALAQASRESISDSALVDFTAIAAFKIAAHNVARASQGVRNAWVIAVPTGSAGWDSLGHHLRVALRSVDTTAADSGRSSLTIDRPEVHGDTLVVHITVGGMFRCRGKDGVWAPGWSQTSMTYEARALRVPGAMPDVRAWVESLTAPCALSPPPTVQQNV